MAKDWSVTNNDGTNPSKMTSIRKLKAMSFSLTAIINDMLLIDSNDKILYKVKDMSFEPTAKS